MRKILLTTAVAVFASQMAIAEEYNEGGNTESESESSAGAAANAFMYNEAASETLYNTPNVIPPALTAGLNQCAQSTSGGISIAGFSFSFGRSRKDNMCELINSASFLFQVGMAEEGKELLCTNDELRRTFVRTGHFCLQDRVNVPLRLDNGELYDVENTYRARLGRNGQ